MRIIGYRSTIGAMLRDLIHQWGPICMNGQIRLLCPQNTKLDTENHN
jgi:hypothetical protein